MSKHLAKEMLGSLITLKRKLPLRSWELAAACAVCAMILLQFLNGAGVVSRYILMAIPFCCCFAVLVMAGLPETYKEVRFSKPMLFCWFGIAILITLTGLVIERNHLIEAALWTVGFPFFFLAWSNRSLEELVRPLIFGIYASFIIFLLISIVAYPLNTTRYKSFFQNQNSLSLYCSAVYTAALADAVSGTRRWISAGIIGWAALMIISTGSRGGLVAVIVGTLLAFLMIVAKEKRKCLRKLASVYIPILLAVILTLFLGAQVMYFAHNMVNAILDPNDAAGDGGGGNVTIDDLMQDQVDRLEQGNGSLDAITTGRVGLWKAYLAEVGLLGNADDEIVYDEAGNTVTRSSHFTLIQMAYSYGIPAALLFLIFNLVSGIRAILFAYGSKECYAMFPVLIAVVYGAYYLVESIYSPVTVLLTMLYLVSQAALFPNKSGQ